MFSSWLKNNKSQGMERAPGEGSEVGGDEREAYQMVLRPGLTCPPPAPARDSQMFTFLLNYLLMGYDQSSVCVWDENEIEIARITILGI